MTTNVVNDDEERSEQHINELYRVALHNLQVYPEVKKFTLDEIVPADYFNRELSLEDLKKLNRSIESILIKNHFDDFRGRDHSIVSSEAHKFINRLRRYFVSDEMRKEIDKGIKFKSASKKRKFEIYQDCAELRLLACQKYRDLIVEAKNIFDADERLSHDKKCSFIRLFYSELRCEDCGKGYGKHKRPGLLVNEFVKTLLNHE